MRKIEVEPPRDALWRRWLRDCDTATRKLLSTVAGGGAPTVGKLYRRKSIKDAFFFGKGPPFYGKCAFCEAPITDYQHGDVEHFRPKLGVTDENDQVVHLRSEDGEILLDGEGRPRKHPGYYWLAYDWRNLLPSCVRCNQAYTPGERKIGKHNRFPVRGRHAQAPEEIAEEEALLINPASGEDDDDPSRHLELDTRTGVMIAKTDRGSMCIEIFGLNVRDQLLADRKRACNEVWYLLRQVLQPGGDAEAARELLEIRDGKRPFSMAQRAVLDEAEKNFARILETAPDDSAAGDGGAG